MMKNKKYVELSARMMELEEENQRLERMLQGLATILSIQIHKGDLEILSILAAECGYEDREISADNMLTELKRVDNSIPEDIKRYFGIETKKVDFRYEDPGTNNFKFGGF